MADIFGQTMGKGTVVKFKADAGVDASSIANIGGFTNAGGDSAFLVDFGATAAERLALMPCFGDTTYIFAYGHDLSVSRSTCTMLVFLGSSACSPADNTKAASTLIDFYKTNRLSQKGSSIGFSLCGNAGFATGYLVSMTVRAYNPDINAATITVTFMSRAPA